MAENQDKKPQLRAAVYIDGFNLYHPIKEMGENHLKWCDLWRLSELICEPNQLTLAKVVLCTAMQVHRPETLGRHRTFNNAQAARGVTVIEGHYIYSDDLGRHTEKQSDINVSLSLILDGLDDVYDWAFLVSADSDQAATARVFKERLAEKKLSIVAPPNRKPPEKAVSYTGIGFSLKKEQIESCLLPEYVPGKTGGFVRRPAEYDPPHGWLPPNRRPKRKKR